ncbi:hypothetical protein ACPDHQ_09010 [Myroides odoratimimus]|uniref:hypothetical protein n=1 Tax=Myroides odoratimimus TaxID=76832 RepID=UPI002578841F|nr:hypothetical protein [Myroides odoratimimus]MDM1093868.1 hypothetical protein [Myroides odoratimimus]
MKKITLLAVLLGTTYFANAQVGIGTPDPATSAELDIVAKAGNKGILIPRVELKNTTEFQMAGKSTESTSLLVFNKTEVKHLVPTGFYYWDGAKWNRIIGKTELDTVIKNLGDNITNITTKLEGDVKNLQAVVNYILPSNPDNKDKDGKPVVTKKHTTIVYNPETKEMFYVTYDNGKYTTKQIDITKMVQGVETKTNIFRTEAKANGKLEAYAAATAPVEANVKKGEIFYKYNNEDKGEQFINMTADIISSINNNEEVKNALTNILNQGGNVYFGDHDNDAATDNVFYTMKIVNGKEEKTPIKLPASFLLEIIKNYKDVIKQALGDNITNEGDIVFTGNIYNGRQVLLAKGSTKANGESARTEGVTLANATGDNAINGVLSIKVLKAGVVVTESTKDVVVAGTKIDFNIGVGNIYTALPADTYEVVVEYLGKEVKPTTQP